MILLITTFFQSPKDTYAENLPIDETNIVAKSFLVKNITTDTVLYEKSASEILPLASLTKLITAMTVREMQKNWVSFPAQIKLVSNGPALNTVDRIVKSGRYLSIDDALSYMLLTSSNYAAYSLSHNIIPYPSFISYMNYTAKKVGAKNMTLINASGLTEVDKKGIHSNSIGSAEDIMTILDLYASQYQKLAKSTRLEEAYLINPKTGEKVVVENTNTHLDKIPNLILGKTGYTDDAGGNLALLIKKNDEIYGIVIMNSTIEDRFKDALYLASML